MSVHAGSILTVGGNNVIDRVQSAGLGDATVPIETIREVGNKLVVDKIPGEPDFTFSMESLDVSTDMMAWLTGKVGAQAEPAGAPGAADADGTEYKWQDCGYVNVTSPWKDALNDAAGNIVAGHLIPAYYPTRVRYAFGVTDFATQTVELGGGAFYYGKAAPVGGIRHRRRPHHRLHHPRPDRPAPHRRRRGHHVPRRLRRHRRRRPADRGRRLHRHRRQRHPGDHHLRRRARRRGARALRLLHRPRPRPTRRPCTPRRSSSPAPSAGATSSSTSAPPARASGSAPFRASSSRPPSTPRSSASSATTSPPAASSTAGLHRHDDRALQGRAGVHRAALKVTGVADDEVFGYLNQNAIPLEIADPEPQEPGRDPQDALRQRRDLPDPGHPGARERADRLLAAL
jgi:hypothetical protein